MRVCVRVCVCGRSCALPTLAGVWRKPGNFKAVQDLKRQWDLGQSVEFLASQSKYDVCSLVKLARDTL